MAKGGSGPGGLCRADGLRMRRLGSGRIRSTMARMEGRGGRIRGGIGGARVGEGDSSSERGHRAVFGCPMCGWRLGGRTEGFHVRVRVGQGMMIYHVRTVYDCHGDTNDAGSAGLGEGVSGWDEFS